MSIETGLSGDAMQGEAVQYYLNRLEEDDSFHSLIEMDDEIIPLLVAAYVAETSSERRAILIEIIGEHRNPDTMPLFAQALLDSDKSVWQEALRWIVSLSGKEAIPALQKALLTASPDKRKWLLEAVEQVQSPTS